jgi:spermidine synthase
LAELKTGYQHVVILENETFGRVLMLDGAVQTTTQDEFIYHEMLAHVPLFTHGSAGDVLIVGGGDCGLAEEVLRHRAVQAVTQVELDPDVAELSRKYLSQINAPVFSDKRFQLHYGDGAAFVSRTQQFFDVVLIDSTDAVGAARALFTADFYLAVKSRLRPGGVLVCQAGVPFVQANQFGSAIRHLAAAFSIVDSYLIASPSYFGGHLAFGWASDDLKADSADLPTLAARYAASGILTRYYTPEVHRAAFVLPAYVAEMRDAASGPWLGGRISIRQNPPSGCRRHRCRGCSRCHASLRPSLADRQCSRSRSHK